MTIKYYVTLPDRLKGGFIIWRMYDLAYMFMKIRFLRTYGCQLNNIADRMRDELILKYFGNKNERVCFTWRCIHTNLKIES